MNDIEIAQAAHLRPINEVAAKLGIGEDSLEHYGRYKAKLSYEFLNSLQDRPDGKLILVTAISPTPPGEGKTTTTIGLADALNRIGKKAVVCIREPSLGPCFGIKGGATGGGYAQVAPMEEINLHFTGDFHAIGVANNLLSALLDNHMYQGNALQLDPARITWHRAMDMNDRALRRITVGVGGGTNSVTRDDGFDITAASEVMAVFCLSRSLAELRERLGNIQVGYSTNPHKPVILARDLQAEGAMTALLKDAFKPNLVQTLEHTPAFVHGGPFANIAHGCNSAIATETSLKLADYVVTEAGFGADLGAEKFIDIKCRKIGLKPAAVVLVVTVRALKYHGGTDLKQLEQEDLVSLQAGISNMARHIENLQQHFGLNVTVAINHFVSDTDAEIALLKAEAERLGAKAIVSRHWAQGGAGAEQLAQTVVASVQNGSGNFRMLYDDNLSLLEKIETVARKIYRADAVTAEPHVLAQLEQLNGQYGHFPVCIAKTQYSFSVDADLRGAPTGHVLPIREVRLSRGAEFVVAICGNIMTMPGLPRRPASERIGVTNEGQISGLS